MAMDRFSALPFELRMHIYSYYFNAHDSHFCTLKIAQQQRGSDRITRPTQQALKTARLLEEHNRSGSAKVAEMIQQIQSTASALSKRIEEEKLIRFPPIIRHCRAIIRLSRVIGEMELAFQVRPTDSCRRFLDLAHVNRRLRADLLWTCEFNLSGNMEVFMKISSKTSTEWRASIAFAHLFISEGEAFSSRTQQRQRYFASLNSLPNLKTVYISGELHEMSPNYDVSSERPMSWGKSTARLLETMERSGIRTVLCLERYSESFVRNNVRSGKWRAMVCDTVEAEEDRERM